MATAASNTLLFLAFAGAIGTAFYYKTAADSLAHPNFPERTAPLAARPYKKDVPKDSMTPKADPKVSSEASPKVQAPKTTPVADENTAESSQEAAALMEAAVKELEAKNSVTAIFKLRRLTRDFGESLEGRSALGRLANIHQKASKQALAASKRSDLVATRKALTQAFLACDKKAKREAILKTLEQTNTKILRSRKALSGFDIYTVQPGDSLGAIAKRFKTTWSSIKRLNRLKSTVIRVGQKLKILTGKVSIEISRERFELVLLLEGDLFKHYYVAIGKEDRTPEGQFTIEERVIKPTWYGPDGPYPFGHEKNILGTRWLGFNRTEECSGFGIHGTKFPESIGTKASMGCIRMKNANVEDLFDYIPRGCTVTIH